MKRLFAFSMFAATIYVLARAREAQLYAELWGYFFGVAAALAWNYADNRIVAASRSDDSREDEV